MTLGGFLLLLLIAGVCGSLAQTLTGYSRGGCLMSIALGFVGAILGTWLAGLLGLGEILAIQIGGQSFPIVWSIIGAALFVALLNLLRPRR
ncbi:MAG: GlsB/YeaQ/YmgE family stress response membrane protein [Planctomycetaceae bacterium]|nr:GlsB/YeaQ/YmgE family stress response membrane protein [Planctomycetaceae bacterium]